MTANFMIVSLSSRILELFVSFSYDLIIELDSCNDQNIKIFGMVTS